MTPFMFWLGWILAGVLLSLLALIIVAGIVQRGVREAELEIAKRLEEP